MGNRSENFNAYFAHLSKITLKGRLYKKYYSSRVLYYCAKSFGSRIVEAGSGAGNGVLGAYPSVYGLDINPVAVEYCKAKGLNAELINENGSYPVLDATYDACILDNVLEHIAEPKMTLDECYRITKNAGGLIIAVPGRKGFNSDSDHKLFYDENRLRTLDSRWRLIKIFSMPLFFISEKASYSMRQYCLVAVYKKLK
ncbi:MAG: class I SAM-dependent methyltransferase [Burkholderiales bacterium]